MQDRIARPAPVLLIPEGGGNDGTVENMENQNQVSHLFHRPLEISQTPRDFHIPTAPTACPLTNQNQERKSPLRGSVFPFFMTFAPSRRKTVFMLILRLENAAPKVL